MKKIILTLIALGFVLQTSAQKIDPTELIDLITKVVVYDQFDDNENDWYVGTDADLPCYLENGIYYMQQRQEGTGWSRWNNNENFTLDPKRSFIIDISVQQFIGEDVLGFGLRFSNKKSDPSSITQFIITGDGSFRIRNSGKLLADWTDSDAINTGLEAVNNITIVRITGSTFFLINYEKVFQVDDASTLGDSIYNIGFFLGGKMVVGVDDFLLAYLD